MTKRNGGILGLRLTHRRSVDWSSIRSWRVGPKSRSADGGQFPVGICPLGGAREADGCVGVGGGSDTCFRVGTSRASSSRGCKDN